MEFTKILDLAMVICAIPNVHCLIMVQISTSFQHISADTAPVFVSLFCFLDSVGASIHRRHGNNNNSTYVSIAMAFWEGPSAERLLQPGETLQ